MTLLLDNELDFEVPDGAMVIADGMLDLDNPDRTGTDKGYKAFYHSFADPNAPTLVDAVLDDKVVESVPISGQLLITISDKAVDKALRRRK